MINNIKTPNDILEYLKENINYGWLGADGKKRIKSMDGFRQFYRTMSFKDVMNEKVGTCVEQVYLMHELMNKIGVQSKMFCTRMYEDETFNDLEAPERMHCFLLFYIDDEVFQLEHPDFNRVGIYKYESENDAIGKIVNIYENMMKEEYKSKNKPAPEGGFKRTTTEFFDVKPGLTYKEFNLYVNGLDDKKIK